MARQAYTSDISLTYINEESGETIEIGKEFVKYILIENIYDNKYMPAIFMSLAVTNELYDKLIKTIDVSKIALTVKIQNAYSETSLYKKYIEGEFTYLVPTINPDLVQTLNPDETVDTAYNEFTIALISMDIMNKMKTSFNGSFNEIDTNTLISLAIQDLDKIVVRKPLYNYEFDRIPIPPMNNRVKLMQFIFNKGPFYDTHYTFFVDFNKAYLLDLTGDYCDDASGEGEAVYIHLVEPTDSESYIEGIDEGDGSYHIYVNSVNTNIAENRGRDKIANQAVFINDNFDVDFVDLEINKGLNSEVKQSFNLGGNAGVYKNDVESNTVIVEIVKDNVNSEMITPNKEYYVKVSSSFKNYDYNGKYVLISKKEIIKNTNGDFGLSVTMGLRKVGNITAIGANATAAGTAGRIGGRHAGGLAGLGGLTGGLSSGGSGISLSGGSSGGIRAQSTEKITAKTDSDKVLIMPTAKRIKATDDSLIRRKIRKISGEE